MGDKSLLDRFEEAGRTIRENYYTPDKQRPDRGVEAIILPLAPNVTEAFRREGDDDRHLLEIQRARKSRRLRNGYEEEVEVFRALNRLEDVIVLYALEYREDSGRVYEDDFIVIGEKEGPEGPCKYVVILEVKVQYYALMRNLRKSLCLSNKQMVKMKKMISEHLVLEQTNPYAAPLILAYSVFPLLLREDVENALNLTNEENRRLVLRDDLNDFSGWWQRNVLSKSTAVKNFPQGFRNNFDNSVQIEDETVTSGFFGILKLAGFNLREIALPGSGLGRGIMFPPNPNVTNHIDTYVETKDYFKRIPIVVKRALKHTEYLQLRVESEIAVYGALRREENIIVLHGLEYTEEQYRACVSSHTQPGGNQITGGHTDFVVIGDKFVVILGVISQTASTKVQEEYGKSKEQMQKTRTMIEGIINSCSNEIPPTFDIISVFPYLTKKDGENYLPREERLVFKDDMKMSELKKLKEWPWWKNNFLSKTQPPDARSINILLGLWSADSGNECKTDMTSYLSDIFEKAGSIIREKYCNREYRLLRSEAIMFPPAPSTEHIDAFHRDDSTLSKKEMDEKEWQDQYEAEVEVFRALEKIENIIVLHGLEYTHQQYQALDPNYTYKKDSWAKKREHDFVVIGDKFVAILEVKSPKLENMVNGYNKSVKQRNDMEKLVKSVFENSNSPKIFVFSVFPRFTKSDIERKKKLRCAKKELLVLKEDMDDFSNWWSDNVVKKVAAGTQPLEERPINILLGLWSADQDNVCHTKKCCLSHCILEIDERLKSENVTSIRRGGPINSEFELSSNFFKEYFHIECLTVEQKEIFESGEKSVWIDGAAGTGKSLLLAGKIIKVIQNEKENLSQGKDSKKKCVLMAFGEKVTKFYEEAFKRAGIKYHRRLLPWEEKLRGITEPRTKRKLRKECDVEIVDCWNKISSCSMTSYLKTLGGYHLFIEDAHSMLSPFHKEVKSSEGEFISLEKMEEFIGKILDFLQKRLENGHLYTWITWDLIQFYVPEDLALGSTSFKIRDYMEKMYQLAQPTIQNFRAFPLKKNLRNTVDIADLLGTLRNEILQSFSGQSRDELPEQERGHIIHGPLPKFYIICSRTSDTNNILTKPGSRDDVIRAEKKYLEKLPLHGELEFIEKPSEDTYYSGNLIPACSEINRTASGEWPAVISYVRDDKGYKDDYDMMLSQLYLRISRARVYSSVIVNLDTFPDLERFLQGYEKYFRVIYVKEPEE